MVYMNLLLSLVNHGLMLLKPTLYIYTPAGGGVIYALLTNRCDGHSSLIFSKTTPMRRLIVPLIAAFLATSALAAPFTVPLDQSRKLSFPGFAASVVVGNPDIADVNVVNEQTILVVGKRQGVTNVVIMDRAGRTLFNREILVATADASAVTINRAGVPVTYACGAGCQQINGSAPGAAPGAIISRPTPAPAAPAAP